MGLADPRRGASWACVPTEHFFLNFMKFFGNLDKKIGLAPPPVENHGLFSRFIKYNGKAEVDLIKWISMGDIYPNFLSSQIIDTFW